MKKTRDDESAFPPIMNQIYAGSKTSNSSHMLTQYNNAHIGAPSHNVVTELIFTSKTDLTRLDYLLFPFVNVSYTLLKNEVDFPALQHTQQHPQLTLFVFKKVISRYIPNMAAVSAKKRVRALMVCVCVCFG